MKKYITIALQIMFLLIVLYLVYVNMANVSDINFVLNSEPVKINTYVIIIALYIFGLLSGAIHSITNKGAYQSQIEFYARKNEKLSQQNEIDSDDKEALQRKIATLEIALENALKKKD